MNEALHIESLTGPAIRPYLDVVARLRIAVFRDFPYLYDGSIDYETDYLAAYSACEESLFVLAYAEDEIVGASTGIPLAAETAALQQPFRAHGLAVESVFYFGESVLLRPYRGRGVGHRFFDAREGYARQLGRFTHTAFCAVERPMDHALRPADYRPLDTFWARRGYHCDRHLQARMGWKDVDQAASTDKTMIFWLRRLDA